MDIKNNNKMWFWRRLIALISLGIICIAIEKLHRITIDIFYNIPLERLLPLQYVFLGAYVFYGLVICVCGLILLSYYHYSTQHDKAFLPSFLPSLIEAFKK